jgi:hypothetical protein
MTRKITSLDDAPVDVVEAVKRGFIHRGFIPRKYRRNSPLSPKFEPDKAAAAPPRNPKSGKGSQKKNADSEKNDPDDSAKQEPDVHHGHSRPKLTPNDNSGPSEGPAKADKSTRESQPGENMDKVDENNKDAETPEGGEGGTHREMPKQNLRNEITSTDPEVSVIDSETGSQEAAKDPDEPEPGKTHEKLIDLTEKSHDILFRADTVFPFTLFPDTITLDREKLTIANRSFFRVAKIITVPITSLVSAEVDVGPFFGAIHMTSKYFLDNTHHLRFLWRHDAERLHRLLQGYIIAHEKGIDVTEVDKDDAKVLLEDLGHGD